MFSPPAVPKMFETVTSALRYHYTPNIIINIMYIIMSKNSMVLK